MVKIGPLELGKEVLAIKETTAGAGTKSVEQNIVSETVIAAVFVEEITGTLDIYIDTITDEGESVRILTLPQISSVTSEVIIKKAATSMDRVRVTAVYSDSCSYSVRLRGANDYSEGSVTGGDGGSNGDIVVSDFTINNITLAVKNTEYTINIPAGTRRFKFQSRTNSILKLAAVSGESSTNYFTIGYGVCYTEENLDTTGLSLFIQSSKDNTEIELLSWS